MPPNTTSFHRILDNEGMHLLIPFAFASSEGCAQAFRQLKLPALQAVLHRLTPQAPDSGDEFSLSPPHERSLAQALGLGGADGRLPWAALQAGSTEGAWAFVSPCHWQIGALHIAMHHAPLPQFSADESQALLAAMQPYFAEDGITLRYEQPQRWLAQGEIFRELATASLDRVAGRQVDRWMPDSAAASSLRRLQSEMQMLLYTHPISETRSQQGLLPVNSFWLHGSGALAALPSPAAGSTPPQAITTLREPALAEDWAAWTQAWQALDAGPVAALGAELAAGRPAMLTLCGERQSQSWVAQPQAFWQKIMNKIRPQPLSSLIEKL
jgi:hypothetical protein